MQGLRLAGSGARSACQLFLYRQQGSLMQYPCSDGLPLADSLKPQPITWPQLCQLPKIAADDYTYFRIPTASIGIRQLHNGLSRSRHLDNAWNNSMREKLWHVCELQRLSLQSIADTVGVQRNAPRLCEEITFGLGSQVLKLTGYHDAQSGIFDCSSLPVKGFDKVRRHAERGGMVQLRCHTFQRGAAHQARTTMATKATLHVCSPRAQHLRHRQPSC